MDDEFNLETLLRLYDITTQKQSSSSRDTLLMMGTFGVIFSVAISFYEQGLYLFIPALAGFCSLLAIWILVGHYWKMGYYSESRILRYEIYRRMSGDRKAGKFPALEMAKAFQRGRFIDDGVLAILGVFYVLFGLTMTYGLITGVVQFSFESIIRFQIAILIVPFLLSSAASWIHDHSEVKTLNEYIRPIENNQDPEPPDNENDDT
jgi:hypothetical protein